MTDTTDNTTPEPAQAVSGPETPSAGQEPGEAAQAGGTAGNAGDGGLGDAGQRALAQERERRREAERQAREAQDQARGSQDRLAELEVAERRRSVAAEKELSPEQAELLSGETAEEMAAHADRLLAAFRSEDTTTGGVRRLPQERLRPGAVPSAGDGDDIAEIADRVTAG